MRKERIVSLLLRFGLASVFAYAGVAAFLQPSAWVGYFPSFLRDMIPEGTLLPLFSIAELILAVWLVSGKYVFLAGTISAAMMLGILVFNPALLDITFRDIGLFFASIALAYLGTDEAS